VEEPADLSGKSLFHACKKCREAFYCCKDHQVSVLLGGMTLLFTGLVVAHDWTTHKNVCEPRSR
jgi:hypothetical protein